MRFVGSQKAKFIRYNLLALVGWIILLIEIIGGGCDSPFLEPPSYSDHPRVAALFFIVYGLVEIVGFGFVAYAFTFVVTPNAFGLLCALGVYAAYLALGSFVELIMWSVRKSHGDDEAIHSSDEE